jgi:hypothetical protein
LQLPHEKRKGAKPTQYTLAKWFNIPGKTVIESTSDSAVESFSGRHLRGTAQNDAKI